MSGSADWDALGPPYRCRNTAPSAGVPRERGGEIRDDLALEQILDLIQAIATIDRDTSYMQPVLQAALDGVRSRHGKACYL